MKIKEVYSNSSVTFSFSNLSAFLIYDNSKQVIELKESVASQNEVIQQLIMDLSVENSQLKWEVSELGARFEERMERTRRMWDQDRWNLSKYAQ